MTVDVVTEAVLDLPPEVVAGYAADPSNAPEWYRNIDSVTWETPPPLARGSQVTFVATFLGRRLTYTYEVTEWLPGARLVMRTAQGPFPMETTYTWEPAGTGTRMTLCNRGEPSGFARVATPVLTAAMRRANRADLEQLRSVLQRRGG
ncbi:SRPBCC family protein [Modestobacter sp. I12A-02662]|uniref:SRPBCC family protein n=1 Tax=Modestobacter sp. I12A-02662 TaxID=1730496 RepID=UPI0034DE60D5